MIHHAKGSAHVAHLLPCPNALPGRGIVEVCEWPILPEGADGKCDWCRRADARWEQLGKESTRTEPMNR